MFFSRKIIKKIHKENRISALSELPKELSPNTKTIRRIYKFFSFVSRLFCRIEIIGLEYVPKHKNFIVVANHYGMWDPFFISTALPHFVEWVSKKELFENKIIARYMNILGSIPVDRNNLDLQTARIMIRKIKQNHCLGIFPEGTRCSNPQKRAKIQPKDGFLAIAKRYNVDILPVAIKGSLKPFGRVKIVFLEPVPSESLKVVNDDLGYTKTLLSQIYKRIDIDYENI